MSDPGSTPRDEGAVAPADELLLLKEHLTSAGKIAARLAWSRARIGALMPLDASRVDVLGDENIERLDAFLYRFNALTAMIQDHVSRALLRAEEEDLTERSRKDQRLLLEKLGAFKPQFGFGSIAELRNRLAHLYPDDSAKQAEILNQAYERSSDLLQIHDDLLAYADQKFFAAKLGLPSASSPA